MVDDADDLFEQRKLTNIAHLLVRSARLINEEGIRRIRAHPRFWEARLAHLSIFPHLDLEGTRLGELARRMDVTKQAVGQLVDELEASGLVARQPDPTDRRARRVVFTEEGRAMMLRGLDLLAEIEDEVLDGLSPSRRAHLRVDLQRIIQALEKMRTST